MADALSFVKLSLLHLPHLSLTVFFLSFPLLPLHVSLPFSLPLFSVSLLLLFLLHPHHLSQQSFALNQKAAAPLTRLPPPFILLITPSAPSPFLLSFHH